MRRDVEAIRRLAGPFDPVAGSTGTGAHADPKGRATLARIIASPRTSPVRPPAKRSWPEVVSLWTVAAAILALGVLLAAHAISGSGSPALAATPPPLAYRASLQGPSGRAVLLRLATTAARQPSAAASGRYGYVKTAGWYLDTRVAAANTTSAIVPSVTESWIAADGSGRVLERAGSTSPGPHLLDATPGQVLDDFKLRAGPRMYPATLSTDPRVLARELALGHPTSIGPVERFVAVTDLALDRPISSQLEAAVLRVLANLPGLIDSGSVTDRAGRTGVAVSLISRRDYPGEYRDRYTLIFAPTGTLLGEEETLISGTGKLNVRIPAVISYTAFLASGYVNSTTARP